HPPDEAASLPARRAAAARLVGDGRTIRRAVRRLSYRPKEDALRDRDARPLEGPRVRGTPCALVLRTRQRDPGLGGTLARAPNHRTVSGAALPGGQRGGPRGTRHVRELPHDRIPAAALPRPPLLQRLSRVTVAVRCLPRPPAEPRREPAAHHERAWARQPPP